MHLSDYLSTEKISQEAFAALIGVSDVTVHRWVTGKSRPAWTHVGPIERETGGKVTAQDFVPVASEP